MHPAPSIIVFTALSGLGFGLLAFLGLGFPDVSGFTAFVFFVVAYALAVGGLVASTFHLGHKERAIKAFREWRSSWLSREGWAAVAALIVMAIYGAGVVFADTRLGIVGVLGSALSIATVFATSMIYTQLKSVPRWYHWTTPVLFLAFAFSGGALLSGQVTAALIGLVVVAVLQIWVWIDGDKRLERSGSTMASATGLVGRGKVESFEPPHTGGNYLLHEMVYVVARKHARVLRVFAIGLTSAIPVIFLLLPFSHVWAGIAVLAHIAGVFVARWLFFAEAEHVVGLYYGKR